MLSVAQWAPLERLIEACRPKGKTPQDLLRTISAILWQHQNGAKWRAVPDELGPWWRAAQIFTHWAKAGVWDRLLSHAQEREVTALSTGATGHCSLLRSPRAGAARKWRDCGSRTWCTTRRCRSGPMT
jgi:transposase